MRVIDLLQLLVDTPKNATVYFENSDHQLWPIGDFELTTVNEQLQLRLHLKDQAKTGLKRWEFSVLLNQKAYYQHFVYVNYQATAYPLFGFRVDQNRILLG